MTEMNAPGLKMILVTFARTGAAWAQESMLEKSGSQIGHEGGEGGNVGVRPSRGWRGDAETATRTARAVPRAV